MNLLDQIDERLKDPSFSLNRDHFEDCATSLLTDIYPNLVPICGGSDDGRDAEISDPDGTIGVLITSARDLKGVLGNLSKGCRQMTKKQVPITRVILANLVELNASKRTKLNEAAHGFGFEERRQHLTKPFRSRDRVILVAVGDEARCGRRVLVRTQGDGQHAASAVRWRPSDAVAHRLVPPRVALVGFSVTVKSRSNDQEAHHPSWAIRPLTCTFISSGGRI